MILQSYRALSRSIRPCALLALLLCFAMTPAWAGPPAHAQGGGGGGGGGNNTESSDDDGDTGQNKPGNRRGHNKDEPEPEPQPEPEPEPPPLASVSLSWDIATERENGDYLDQHDIEGHEIVYRQDHQTSWSGSIYESQSLHGTTIDDLKPGSYYFAARTQDRDGLWSDYSEEMLMQVD